MTRHSARRVMSRRILFAPIRHGGTALMGRGEIRLIRLLRGSAAHRFTAQVASKGEAWQSSQDQRERDDKPASALHDRSRQPEGRWVHSLIGCKGTKLAAISLGRAVADPCLGPSRVHPW